MRCVLVGHKCMLLASPQQSHSHQHNTTHTTHRPATPTPTPHRQDGPKRLPGWLCPGTFRKTNLPFPFLSPPPPSVASAGPMDEYLCSPRPRALLLLTLTGALRRPCLFYSRLFYSPPCPPCSRSSVVASILIEPPPPLSTPPPPPSSLPLQEQKPDTGITGIDWAEKKAEASKAARETAEYVKVCLGGRKGGREEHRVIQNPIFYSNPLYPLYFLPLVLGARQRGGGLHQGK